MDDGLLGALGWKDYLARQLPVAAASDKDPWDSRDVVNRVEPWKPSTEAKKIPLPKHLKQKSATPPSFRIAFSDHLAAIPSLLL